jgi:hypothetical protein
VSARGIVADAIAWHWLRSMSERSVVDRVAAVLERLQRDERGRALRALIVDGGYSDAMAERGLDAACSVFTRVALDRYVAEHGDELAGQRVALALARSVGTAPIRSIALCFLRGARAVCVRAPRTQRAVAALVVELAANEGFDCALTEELDGREWLRATLKSGVDAVIAFGTDAFVNEARATVLESGARFEGSGHGEGVAWVDAAVSDEEVERIAWDFCAYDGVGCLSPSVLWVTGGEREARAVGARLAAAIGRWGRSVARGSLGREGAAHERAWRAGAAAAAVSVERGEGYCVLVFAEGEGDQVPAFGARNVIVRCAGERGDGAARWIAERARWLTVIAVDRRTRARLEGVRERAGAALRARVVSPGEMQSPPLDGEADPRGAG